VRLEPEELGAGQPLVAALPEHAILAAPHYAFRDCDAVVRARGITPHIRQKGKPTLVGRVHGEHAAGSSSGTNSWHNRFRVLLIRWEVKARNDLALVYLASALITRQQSHWFLRPVLNLLSTAPR